MESSKIPAYLHTYQLSFLLQGCTIGVQSNMEKNCVERMNLECSKIDLHFSNLNQQINLL